MSSSLQVTDEQAAAVATKPRVTLQDIERAIKAEYTFVASKALAGMALPAVDALKVFTMHIIVMANDFVFVGKSAPASPGNFNADLGAKFAREDAIRQIWPVMGYALRERLQGEADYKSLTTGKEST